MTEAMTCMHCMWNSGPGRHQGRRRLAGGLACGARAHKASWPGALGAIMDSDGFQTPACLGSNSRILDSVGLGWALGICIS